jgi:antitoxin YefM
MLAVNYSNLRDNMKGYFDRVAEDRETLIVTRKDENMVIMSQSSYDSLMETLYLVSNHANYEHLMDSVSQYKAGKGKVHELLGEEDE